MIHGGSPEEILQPIQNYVWECDVSKDEYERLGQNYIIANIKYHCGEDHLRIVSETAPCETAKNVEPTLEDLYLYYFVEESGHV